jgi:hypothetical protein
MIMSATAENNVASPVRQYPAIFCNERNKVWFIVSLEMRKNTPMKAHGVLLFHFVSQFLV